MSMSSFLDRGPIFCESVLNEIRLVWVGWSVSRLGLVVGVREVFSRRQLHKNPSLSQGLLLLFVL